MGGDPPATLTLREAVTVAVEQNPAAAAARQGVEASEARIQQARSELYPQCNFTETFNRTTNPMWAFATRLNQETIEQTDFAPEQVNHPQEINNFASTLSVEWALFNGGRTRIAIEQAAGGRDASAEILKRTRQEIIARTAQSYIELLLSLKNVDVVRQSLETADVHLKMVQSRFENGFVVKSDLLQARVRIAELQQALLQAESRVKMAQAMLSASMGLSVEQTVMPVTPLDRYTEPTGSMEEWIAKTLSHRPELQQMQIQENIAKQEVEKSKAFHLPNINLVGAYEINSEDFSDTADNYTLGAMMRINLFSGRLFSSKTKESLASFRQSQSMRKELELIVLVETKKAFLESRSAWERIQVAESAVSQAQEALRIIRNRYENGFLTILSLLDAEVALQQSRDRHFQAMHDYQLATIRLFQATGTIDIDSFGE